jgi:hypothetical protein
MDKCGIIYCYDGIKKFYHMDDVVLRDELITDFSLNGLFPCNYTTYTEWADWYNHWMDDMMRYYKINEVKE